jgi:hypothetical protein
MRTILCKITTIYADLQTSPLHLVRAVVFPGTQKLDSIALSLSTPFQKRLHHIARQPQFFCLRTNVHHQFIPGFAIGVFKVLDPEAEIGIGFVDDADALAGNLRPEQGIAVFTSCFFLAWDVGASISDVFDGCYCFAIV